MKYRFIRFPEGKTKAVTFSYDDGCRQDLRTAATFDRYGLKGTFNVNSARLGDTPGEGNLTADEIRTHILDKGHEVAVHGEWHKAPGLLRPIDGIKDALNCRIRLEAAFGRIIRGMAYPDSGVRTFANGTDYETIRNYLQALDIAYARTLGGDNDRFELPADWYQWTPTAHHNNPHTMDWAKEFVTMDVDGQYCAGRNARLFYVWGHSYEFDRDGNWDRLTALCDLLAGKPDIWYAANMEIYAYVHAYDSLVFSAEGSLVYNPTVQTVWFSDDGRLYCVKPDETKTI